MPRAVLLTICFFSIPWFSGCAFPYVYPKLDLTQSLQIDAPAPEVHVFRVDIAQSKAIFSIFEQQRLTELSLPDSGKVRTQIKSSLPFGVYLFMVALNYDFRLSNSLALRAYRPGYELIEVESWEQIEQVQWIPALTIEAQEIALQQLLPLGEENDRGNHAHVCAGSSSAAHRRALLFGAAEYERLAIQAESPDEKTRLREKASAIRAHAEQ